MSNYFTNTFDNWCGGIFVQNNVFPPRRFQCDLNDRNTVLSANNWQGNRFCDNYENWSVGNKYDNFGWNCNFDDCKRCVPCESCEPCKECEPCKPCEPCKFKCEEEKKCKPCNYKWEEDDNFNWNKNEDYKKGNQCKKRKFDWDNERGRENNVHWTEDKDIWPHDYLPWEKKGKDEIRQNY